MDFNIWLLSNKKTMSHKTGFRRLSFLKMYFSFKTINSHYFSFRFVLFSFIFIYIPLNLRSVMTFFFRFVFSSLPCINKVLPIVLNSSVIKFQEYFDSSGLPGNSEMQTVLFLEFTLQWSLLFSPTHCCPVRTYNTRYLPSKVLLKLYRVKRLQGTGLRMLSDSSDLLVYRIKVCFNKKEKKEKNFSP